MNMILVSDNESIEIEGGRGVAEALIEETLGQPVSLDPGYNATKFIIEVFKATNAPTPYRSGPNHTSGNELYQGITR